MPVAVEKREARRPPLPVINHAGVWRWQKWHLWLLIAGLLIRIAFCLVTDKEASFGGWDGKEYYAYGQSLLALKWDHYPRYFNSIRPPFYPIFLMPFLALDSQRVGHIQLAQVALGVLQAVILAKIAGRWAGQRAGNWAFILVLFHPVLIYYPAFIITETVFITLLWLGIACLQRLDDPQAAGRSRWLTCGALALGLAALTRPALQPFLVVAVLWVGWRIWRMSNLVTALKRMASFTVVVSALLLPWMIGNLWAHGEFTLSPGAAQSMYAFSNSPEYLRMYEAKTKEDYYENFQQLVARFSVESGTPPEMWMDEARDFRRDQSADWWRLQWHKFKHFWTPWLNPLIFSRSIYLLSLFTITPLFLMAAAELFRRRASIDAFLILLLGLVAVGYLVGGLLFHTQVRYRFPFVDLTFMVLTASLLGHLTLERITESKLIKFIRPSEALQVHSAVEKRGSSNA